MYSSIFTYTLITTSLLSKLRIYYDNDEFYTGIEDNYYSSYSNIN